MKKFADNSVFVVALALMIAGCNDKPTDAPNPSASVVKPMSAAAAPPPVGAALHDFIVDVTLSPAAKKRMSEGGETIVVSASYFGWPLPAAEDKADDVGQIDMGGAEQEFSEPARAAFDDKGFRADRLDLLKGEPQVNVNTYSGRKTSDDNLLACDFFQGSLQVAGSAPITLHCSLIEEQAITGNKAPSD